jgi:hypothetical protein
MQSEFYFFEATGGFRIPKREGGNKTKRKKKENKTKSL